MIIVQLCCAGAWSDDLAVPEHGKKINVFILAGQSNMEGRADGVKVLSQDKERPAAVQNRVRVLKL